MKGFIDEDFLLNGDIQRSIFHGCAKKLPIIDYHSHVPAAEIAKNRVFSNISELWLEHDHYKWRAMRSAGIDEKYITGESSDYDKFRALCEAMPRLCGNPLYHWCHLELRRYFGCELLLNPRNCDRIWEITAEKLREMPVKKIVESSRVEVLCTTDDPADSLEYHRAIASGDFPVRVLPTFRPDRALNSDRSDFPAYVEKLGAASGIKINDFSGLIEALKLRIDYFDSLDCRSADHSLDNYVGFIKPNEYAASQVFSEAMSGHAPDEERLALYKCEVLRLLAPEYKKRGWVMQLHFGVLRNANTAFFKRLGPDCGCDVIHGKSCVADLASLLDYLDSSGCLPKTILYSANPSDNGALAALIGAFQTRATARLPRVMQGCAWWFNDSIAGMRAQLDTLSSQSAIGSFIGMLTDSRSFTSYVRHEYFRRVFCSWLGEKAESGLFPASSDALIQTVADVSYNNTKEFFGF